MNEQNGRICRVQGLESTIRTRTNQQRWYLRLRPYGCFFMVSDPDRAKHSATYGSPEEKQPGRMLRPYGRYRGQYGGFRGGQNDSMGYVPLPLHPPYGYYGYGYIYSLLAWFWIDRRDGHFHPVPPPAFGQVEGFIDLLQDILCRFAVLGEFRDPHRDSDHL